MVQVRYVVWMSVWIFSVSWAQDVDIAQLLVNTEGVRLSDPQLFNKNIDILESKVEKMTNEQSCLFDYLSAYQMAYKGQYESLDGLLNQKLGQCEFPAIQARMYALRANTLVISGKFEAGLENLDLAIEKAQLAKNEKVLTYVYSAAGIVYDSINQTSLSIKYAELTQEIHPSGQNLCKLNYFVYKAKVEDINTPINQLGIESAIKQCKENKQAISYLFLSFYYLKHQVEATYSNDFSLSQVSEKLAQLELDVSRTNYPNIQSFYWAMVAFVDEKLGHIEQAERAANLSLKINEDFGDTEQKVMSLEVLLQVALQKANDEAAYILLKERTDSEQRRFNEKQAKLAAFMKVKHDNLAKTHEISMLSQKNKLLEMEQVITKQGESNQRLLVLLLTVLLVFFVLWIWRAHRRQVELKKLSESDHLTKVLNRQGLEAQVAVALDVAEDNNQIVHMAILDLDHFKQVNDEFGLHTRWAFPLRGIEKLLEQDESDWPLRPPAAISHTIFPGTVIIVNPSDTQIIRVEPGERVDSCVVVFLGACEEAVFNNKAQLEQSIKTYEFGRKIFESEDLPAAEQCQRGINAGLSKVIVGANEPVVQMWYQRWQKNLKT